MADIAALMFSESLLSSKDNLKSFVLPEELLVNPPETPRYDNLYVFIPKSGDWEDIHNWFDCIVTGINCN